MGPHVRFGHITSFPSSRNHWEFLEVLTQPEPRHHGPFFINIILDDCRICSCTRRNLKQSWFQVHFDCSYLEFVCFMNSIQALMATWMSQWLSAVCHIFSTSTTLRAEALMPLAEFVSSVSDIRQSTISDGWHCHGWAFVAQLLLKLVSSTKIAIDILNLPVLLDICQWVELPLLTV